MAKRLLSDFSVSRLLLGGRSFPTPEDEVRARLFAGVFFLCLPMPFVNALRIRALIGAFPLFSTAAAVLLIVLLAGLRFAFSARPAGLLFGVGLQLSFVEAYVYLESLTMGIGLVFVPFIVVLTSGRKVASALLVPAVAFAFRFYRFNPLFSDLFRGLGVWSFSPESINYLVFTGIMFTAGCTVEKIALSVYAAYLSEKAATSREMRSRRAQERLMETVLRSIPAPVFVKDRELRYALCSDSFYEFLGFERERVLGADAQTLFPAPLAAVLSEADARLLETGAVQSATVKQERPDGRLVYATILKTPLRDEAGAVSGIVGVVLDETERIGRERGLESLLESNRGALALLGHDLRNPIGSFRDLVKSMEGDARIDPAEFREVLSEMGKSLDTLYRLLDELLEWAKAEGGIERFEPRPFALRPHVEKVFSVLSDQAALKQVSLRQQVGGEDAVFADERMLETVLRNLAANALKFTPKGGSVTVSAARLAAPPGTAVSVSDTGIGLSPAAVRAIYDRGSLGTRRGTEGEPGTGLGLPLCRRLVERHGGTMEVESAEGSGSVFTVFFPDAAAPGSERPALS